MALLELLAWPAYLPGAGRVDIRLHHPPSVSEAVQAPELEDPGRRHKGWRLLSGFPLTKPDGEACDCSKRVLRETERKYENEAVILPFMGVNVSFLPRSETQFVVEQPEDVLSMRAQTIDNLELDCTGVVPKPECRS